MKNLVMIAMLLCCGVAAAETKLSIKKGFEVREGMTTNEIVTIMGMPPTSIRPSHRGAEIWMWQKKNPLLGPLYVSFGIYDGKVIQTPVQMPAFAMEYEKRQVIRDAEQTFTNRVNLLADAKMAPTPTALEQLREDRADKEKSFREAYYRRHPDMDVELREKLDVGEIEMADGIKIESQMEAVQGALRYFKLRKEIVDGYLTTHTNLEPKIAKAISSRGVCVGMSEDQVWVAMGTPDKKTKTVNSEGEFATWVYKKLTRETRVTFKDQLVASYEENESLDGK